MYKRQVLQPSRNDIHKSGQPLAVEAESATVSSVHTPAETPVNTAGSTVDHSERQLLQQQHSTTQCQPLTQVGPAQVSGGGGAVGVQQQHSTVQNGTDLTDHGRQTVSGRPGVGERQSDQNLSPVSPLGDAEYDAHLRLSAGQREQLVQQSLPAGLGPLRGDRQMRLQCSSSMGDAFTAPESEHEFLVLSDQMYDGLPGPITGRSADAQSVPALDRTEWYSTVQYSTAGYRREYQR